MLLLHFPNKSIVRGIDRRGRVNLELPRTSPCGIALINETEDILFSEQLYQSKCFTQDLCITVGRAHLVITAGTNFGNGNEVQ